MCSNSAQVVCWGGAGEGYKAAATAFSPAFLREKKKKKARHHRPRSPSFGNCGWEGPLGLVRQSGQADSPFPALQAVGDPRSKAPGWVGWRAALGGRQHWLQWVCSCWFLPFSLPYPPSSCLTSHSSSTKDSCLPSGDTPELASLLQPLPLSEHPQQKGRERKALRKKRPFSLTCSSVAYFWVCRDTFVNTAFPLMLFRGIAVMRHPVGQGRKEPSGEDSCGQCRAVTSLQVGSKLQAACRSHFSGGLTCEAPDSKVWCALFPAELFWALQSVQVPRHSGEQICIHLITQNCLNLMFVKDTDFCNRFHSQILKGKNVSRCLSKEMPTSCSSPALQCRALLLLSRPSCLSSPPAAMSS